MRTLRFPLPLLLVVPLLTAAANVPLPDPTRPSDYFARRAATEELPKEIVNWNLTAVRISSQGRSAIINGQFVRVGDVIGKGTVLEINHDSVVLDYNRQEFIVNLLPFNIKRTMSARE